MGSVHRRALLAVALALALLAAAGCGPIADRPASLRLGFDSLDGSLEVWPARGNLATDAAASAAVTAAVRQWRAPTGDRVHLPSSGILWLGAVDGTSLGLVAATVPGGAASWLLQVTRTGSAFEVTRAARYTEPGYLVYSDMLPVSLAGGRRYLASARVQQLLGPNGDPLELTDGLSAPADVPRCGAVTVTAALRTTQSQPDGQPKSRVIDLGTGTEDPRYPLVTDGSGSGVKALTGLDTCALAAKNGPFGSIPQRNTTGKPADGVPMSWPYEEITARPLEDVTIDQDQPAHLEQLSWHTHDGIMTALVYRTETGAPVVSPADRARTLQAYVLPLPSRKLVALVWRAAPDTTLALPPDASKLIDKPGLVLVPRSDKDQKFSLVTPDKTHFRSVTDRPADAGVVD